MQSLKRRIQFTVRILASGHKAWEPAVLTSESLGIHFAFGTEAGSLKLCYRVGVRDLSCRRLEDKVA